MPRAMTAPAMTGRPHTVFTPKNGQWFVAMIVGCPEDRYRDVRRNLAEKAGIAAPYHIEDKDAKRSADMHPSADVDFALIMADFIGHQGALITRAALRKAGVPAMLADSRWSKLRNVLYRFNLNGRELPLAVQTSLINRGTGFGPTPIHSEPTPALHAVQEPIPDPGCPPWREPPDMPPASATEDIVETGVLRTPKAAQFVALFAQEIRLRMAEAGLKTVMISAEDVALEYVKPEREP